MADNSIALQVQTPDSFKTIGNVMNMATTAQHLQAGKQAIGLQNIELQKAQQANQERLGLQQFMSNPDNFQTNGNIDLDKINKAVPAIAPMTGSKVIEHLTTLANAQTTANQAKLNFTGSERNILAGLYGVMGRAGIDDPKAVSAEMDNLKTLYPDNQNLHQYIDAAKVGLQNIPPGKGAVNKSLITTSQSLLNPSEQQGALTPTAGLVNVGGGQNVATSTPAVGGNQPNISVNQSPAIANTLAPGQLESIEQDAMGNKHVVSRSPTGAILSTRPVPGSNVGGGTNVPGSGFARFTPGQQQDIAQAQQEVVGIRASGDAVPTTRNINQRILQLSRDAMTGPGTPKWQAALGGFSTLWGGTEQVNNYQELGKFLEKNAIQNMTAMGGPPSDARLSAAAAANGSTVFNAGALQAVTKFNDATTSAIDKYRQGVDKAVGMKNSDYTALPAFKSAWAKNMDVDVFRVENAIRDGDKAELQAIAKQLGPERMKQLAQKRKNLETLSSTGRLP